MAQIQKAIDNHKTCVHYVSKSTKSELLIPVLLNDNKISCIGIVYLASSVMPLCLNQVDVIVIQYPHTYTTDYILIIFEIWKTHIQIEFMEYIVNTFNLHSLDFPSYFFFSENITRTFNMICTLMLKAYME